MSRISALDPAGPLFLKHFFDGDISEDTVNARLNSGRLLADLFKLKFRFFSLKMMLILLMQFTLMPLCMVAMWQ